jgi:hypothetical protein
VLPPPQRKVKEGDQFPQRGPQMLELRNVLNIKEYCEKLRSKNSENLFLIPSYAKIRFGKKLLRALLFADKRRPPSPTFSEKIF